MSFISDVSRSSKRIAKLYSSKTPTRLPSVLSPSLVSQPSSWSLTFAGSSEFAELKRPGH